MPTCIWITLTWDTANASKYHWRPSFKILGDHLKNLCYHNYFWANWAPIYFIQDSTLKLLFATVVNIKHALVFGLFNAFCLILHRDRMLGLTQTMKKQIKSSFCLQFITSEEISITVRVPVFGRHQFFGTSEHYGKIHGRLLFGWMNNNYTACCWFHTFSNILILPLQFWQIRFESYWLHCLKCWILVLLWYGRGTSPRQDTSSRHPAYKLAFCAQGRNNLRAGLSTIAQQAQRFDLPLRNEVKTGKKLLKIVCFLQFNFFNFCDSTNSSYNAP